jgi:hypothetical protein
MSPRHQTSIEAEQETTMKLFSNHAKTFFALGWFSMSI